MNYTNDKEQIVFLKDGDIVANLDGTTLSGNQVTANGVASFDLVSELHNQLTAADDVLSSNIVGLWADVKGGVNYKGHLVGTFVSQTQTKPLSAIFKDFYSDKPETFELNNGWLYMFTSASEDEKYTTADGLELENHDYIIIHSHDGADSVAIQDITVEKVDVIDAADNDYVRQADLDGVHNELTTSIDELERKHDEDVESLSGTVNSDYVHLSGDAGVGTLQLNGNLSVAATATFGNSDTNSKLAITNTGSFEYTVDTRTAPREYEIKLQDKAGTIAFTSDVGALSTSLSGSVDTAVESLSTDLSTTVNNEFVHLSGDTVNGKLIVEDGLDVKGYLNIGRGRVHGGFNFDVNEGVLYTAHNDTDTPIEDLPNRKWHSHWFILRMLAIFQLH